MPMHFLVGDASDPEALADPFTGGALDRAGVRRCSPRWPGDAWPGTSTTSTRCRPARVVVRMLTNLQASYARRDDPCRRAMVAMMRAASPSCAPRRPPHARVLAPFN